ncbi:MAG: hypothetical protein HYU52_06370 [Acidobacteria bacterium]|nr:hypothetical protein [Acidobacteriota bacterium]
MRRSFVLLGIPLMLIAVGCGKPAGDADRKAVPIRATDVAAQPATEPAVPASTPPATEPPTATLVEADTTPAAPASTATTPSAPKPAIAPSRPGPAPAPATSTPTAAAAPPPVTTATAAPPVDATAAKPAEDIPPVAAPAPASQPAPRASSGKAPKTHTVNREGIMHAPDAESAGSKCAMCHGKELKGGKMAKTPCYECHEKNWKQAGGLG